MRESIEERIAKVRAREKALQAGRWISMSVEYKNGERLQIINEKVDLLLELCANIHRELPK